MITIEFTRTTEDIIAFSRYIGWYRLKKSKQILNKIAWGLFFIAPYILFILILMNSLKITSVAGVILFGLLIFFVGYTATEPGLMKRYEKYAKQLVKDKNYNELIGHTILTITSEEIHWTSDYSQGTSHLKTVKELIEDKAHYYLMTASGSAWIIPKTALKTEEEITALKELFQHHA